MERSEELKITCQRRSDRNINNMAILGRGLSDLRSGVGTEVNVDLLLYNCPAIFLYTKSTNIIFLQKYEQTRSSSYDKVGKRFELGREVKSRLKPLKANNRSNASPAI